MAVISKRPSFYALFDFLGDDYRIDFYEDRSVVDFHFVDVYTNIDDGFPAVVLVNDGYHALDLFDSLASRFLVDAFFYEDGLLIHQFHP